MQCTVWERAWYMRGMENLMVDMMTEDPIAEAILDRVTEIAVLRAESYARSGVDVLFLGDDAGMQHAVMMSEELYCTWLKPRLSRVIAAARAINPVRREVFRNLDIAGERGGLYPRLSGISLK